MQETVKEKSLFSSMLAYIDAHEKKIEDERQLREEKYLRRTQRLYDFHERQTREAAELRRCVELVSQHARVLETALSGGEVGTDGEGVPLAAALVRQAGGLQRAMAAVLRDAATIRRAVAANHQPQLDCLLARMERSVCVWAGVVQQCADVWCRSETLADNLLNMIAEQKRCARELSSSNVLATLCASPHAPSPAPSSPGTGGPAGAREGAVVTASPPLESCAHSCSTPIGKH